MKKILIGAMLVLSITACKKDHAVTPDKTGNVSFYNGNIREIMTVTVNGQIIGKTKIKPLGFVPDCTTEWVVRITNKPGTYHFEATNSDSTTIVTGSLEITENGCTAIPLNI